MQVNFDFYVFEKAIVQLVKANVRKFLFFQVANKYSRNLLITIEKLHILFCYFPMIKM